MPKRLALKCPVRLKVFEDHSTTDFKCEYTTFVHDHSGLTYNPKMKQFVKDKIFDLRMQHRMKPKQIRKYLQTEPVFKDEPTPKIRSIRYALEIATQTEIHPTFTFGQLIEWCVQLTDDPPTQDDAFVIAHQSDEENNSFTFVMSTLRCLEHASNCSNIVADGTYKLNWEDYPIVVVGTLDRMQHFHILAMCVTTNERESDYNFVFNSIQNAAAKYHNRKMDPKVLISDYAYPIRNAFYEVFPSAEKNVVCWSHVSRNLHGFKYQDKKKNYEPIRKDVDVLQASPDMNTFKYVADLLISKWNNAEPEFCEYFKKTWVDRSNTWFGGYALFEPATNNGNEGFNLILKRDYTLRERLPFNSFKMVFKNMVADLSQQYSTECGKKPKQIIDTPIVSIDDYRVALAWLGDPLNKVVILESTSVNTKLIAISSKYKQTISDSVVPSAKEIKAFDSLNFEEFDEYKSIGFNMIYRIEIDKRNWKAASHCSCICFQKRTMCKHLIGLALTLNLEKCPPEAKISKLPQKKSRKVGRTAKAKPALQRQS